MFLFLLVFSEMVYCKKSLNAKTDKFIQAATNEIEFNSHE